jgi:hypothetical protein
MVMKEIKLTKGYVALVDDEDYEKLSERSWHVSFSNKNKRHKQHVYAQVTIKKDGIKKTYKIHRIILGVNDPKIDVDHINGNTLDNRRCNLRLCSRSDNNKNSIKRSKLDSKSPVSKYKGVRYSFIYKPNGKKHIRSKPWMAAGSENGKPVHLGYFKTELEAAKAYNEFALKYYGEFAKINEIEDKNE